MRTLFTLLMLGILLNANTCRNASPTDLGAMADTKWVLTTLAGSPLALPKGAQVPWLQLNAAEGRMNGFGGCNNMFGNFKFKGEQINLSGLGATKKLCEGVMPVETGFTEALSVANRFKLDGSTLTLLQDTKELATLVAGK